MQLFKKKADVQRTCEYCGKTFTVPSSWPSQKFCSHECYAESIREIHVTKEQLEHWYFELHMTSIEIAEQLGCNDRHVREMMSKLGIKLRGKSEAAIEYPCQPFSGDLAEKAYLIGFRLGDLNVYKDMAGSHRISVRSSTTVKEQIDLIRGLFEPYGHVHFRKGTIGETQIECRLDSSFEFLLPKEDCIPEWVQENDDCFWAFAAGYTDAEGYIAARPAKNHEQAIIEIASCGVGILGDLQRGFLARSVTCSLHLQRQGGAVDKNGKRNNFDYYRLVIVRKASVVLFFSGISPYLRHGDKCRRMERAWHVARSQKNS